MAIRQKKNFKAVGIREVRKGESGSTHMEMLNFAGDRINEEEKAQCETLRGKTHTVMVRSPTLSD